MSNVTNYFKVGSRHFFFFVGAVLESVEDAYRAANLVGSPAIYTPAEVAGPWDSCSVIGHRPRAEILRDLANGSSLPIDEFNLLEDELQALHDTFLDAGRLVPPMGVAA